MRKHDFYYNSQRTSCTKCVKLLVLAIFCLAVTTFALLEVSNFYTDEPTVARILLNSFQSSKELESYSPGSNEFVSANLDEREQQQNKKDFYGRQAWNGERQVRAADKNNTNSLEQKSNSYYEEQAPVVVYSKTDIDSSIASRQMAEVPPKQDADEDDPYSNAFGGDYEDRDDNDYFAQHDPYEYYKKQQQQQPFPEPYHSQQPSASHYSQPQPYYPESSPSPQYYDDSREDFSSPDSNPTNSEKARSSQYHDYGNHYGQYPYAATASPPQAALSGSNKRPPVAYSNRRFPVRKVQPQYREPFPTFMDDYEYLPDQSHAVATQRPAYANRQIDQQMSQYRTRSTPAPPEENPEAGQQMDFLTMFKSIKTMWDLYQSFTSSWNTLAEKRNREEEMAKQKYKQQQRIRINSRKPPKFNVRKNATTATNKNQRTTTTSSTEMPHDLITSNAGEEEQSEKQQPAAKVEPRKSLKGTKPKTESVESSRDKRQAANGMTGSTDVAEARYIKGDPLKGYYDFVITEGSYKFWAAFQVGTAILIIYSTFAAIYYSKVNPLVSDYDYTDYLGGARSLSGGDLDFVDDDSSGVAEAQRPGWLEWLPRASHSLKFVLDAIDKLPTDHAAKPGAKEVNERDGSVEVITDGVVYRDDTRTTADTEASNKENESSYETEDSSEMQRKNNAM